MEIGKNNDRLQSGRPKSTSKSQVQEFDSPSNCTSKMLSVSASSVRRRLTAVGLNGCCAARKPLLRLVNKHKRLIWVKKHQNWIADQWKQVLWTAESKFEIFRSWRWVYVRWRTNEWMITALLPTVKHSGGNVNIWRCFVGNTAGDIYWVPGILNQHEYHAILQYHAIPSGMQLIGNRFVFMQDNDLKHTCKRYKNYLQKKIS